MPTMTHYMELLATAQPWNLILFMAIPVVLAETIAISELYLLFTRAERGAVRAISKWAGIAAGIYFLGVFCYLIVNTVIPITTQMAWRGAVDVIAVFSYLAGVVPLGGIALLELGILGRGRSEEDKRKMHAVFVAIFLVVAHVAMIFGMLNPAIFTAGVQHAMAM